MQVGFVNSLAFAKSGRFLVAGVGQVRFSPFIYFDVLQLKISLHILSCFCNNLCSEGVVQI